MSQSTLVKSTVKWRDLFYWLYEVGMEELSKMGFVR